MGVQLTHGYGMTEVPMITMGSPDDTADNLATTEGRPPEGMEIRIVDGEVRLRGKAVCQGYLDPAGTAEAFDPEGFLATGDLGHLTDTGHLVLTGRLEDVIIRKGENISAKETEDLLHTHPAVGDVAVIGLPGPGTGRAGVRGGGTTGGDREPDPGHGDGTPESGGSLGPRTAGTAGGGGVPATERDIEEGAEVPAAGAVFRSGGLTGRPEKGRGPVPPGDPGRRACLAPGWSGAEAARCASWSGLESARCAGVVRGGGRALRRVVRVGEFALRRGDPGRRPRVAPG
ncbi:hypothetical protein RKD18_003855 [Streptomyces phaeoluteigriseus]